MKNFGYYMAMVVVQFAYGGSNILIKIALARRLNQFVFLVYRHILAMLLKERPSLSLPMFGQIFLFSSLGTTIHLNLYFAALVYTSPTVATAWSIVIPSLTFLMAVFLRMEKVKIRSGSGGAKVSGTFWRVGFQLKGFVERPLINIYGRNGSALVLVSYLAWSGWLILQAKVYPPQLSLNALMCFIASLQSSVLALVFCKKSTPVETGAECTAFDHHGVVLSEFVFYLQTWCIINKGPVFSAMFTPLLVVVAIFSAIVFAERLHLGSLFAWFSFGWVWKIFSMVGTFLIVLGLCFVLWGKRRDSFVAGNTKNGDDKRLVVISSIKCPIATREAMWLRKMLITCFHPNMLISNFESG
ncbi:hypothetical protein ES332_A08G129000v1 [Gossypium tomentosum]|uniref:WAT1-related protein n=1 Tax=Gossypium tomentosum TaxID=34277 RepID=A0A5D2PIB5_GOSTO|nr:hypothetical protein ES332_A08G129000v1 [Gossypium tomentosum]